MGTEILRPQDCLIERLRVGPVTPVISRRKSTTTYSANSYSKPSRKTDTRQVQKKWHHHHHHQPDPSFLKKSTTTTKTTVDSSSRSVKNDIGIGEVTILKRGESLEIINNRKNDNNLMKRTVSSTVDLLICGGGSERLGPDPKMVPKQIRITDRKSTSSSVVRSEVYAGSAFFHSPSPSSLPLPTFFSTTKKEGLAAIVDDSATKDLRRLLGLA